MEDDQIAISGPPSPHVEKEEEKQREVKPILLPRGNSRNLSELGRGIGRK